MIEKCKLLQKIYILQSNIIESNVNNRPFVAEVSTIDYAVNECFDGILIKEETENKFLNNIITVKNLVLELEKLYSINTNMVNEIGSEIIYESMFECATKASYRLNVELMIIFTDNYKFVKKLVILRPRCLIIYPSVDNEEIKIVNMFRGVTPFKYEFENIRQEELINNILVLAKENNLIDKKSKVIFVNAYTKKEFLYRNGMFFI